MFKVFTQGDRKYVTFCIFKKLFRSRLWFYAHLWLLALFLQYTAERMDFSFDWFCQTFMAVFVFQFLVADCIIFRKAFN